MKKTTSLFHRVKSKLQGAAAFAALTSVSIVSLNSCGLFEKKSEKKNDQQRSEDIKNNENSNELPLTSATPTPPPSIEPTASPSAPPDAVIKFSAVQTTLETTCGICHGNGQAPELITFADYKANRELVVSELESKAMPPFLMSGEDPTLWTSTAEGKLVLEYFKQAGELVPE